MNEDNNLEVTTEAAGASVTTEVDVSVDNCTECGDPLGSTGPVCYTCQQEGDDVDV